MNFTIDRIEQQAEDELDGAAYHMTIARPLLEQMLALLREQRAEIERLRSEIQTERNIHVQRL